MHCLLRRPPRRSQAAKPTQLPTPHAVFLIPVLWPALHRRSFARWRVLALAFLRLLLLALPFNFSTRVVDAIAPALGTGTFAWVSHASELFVGESTGHPLLGGGASRRGRQLLKALRLQSICAPGRDSGSDSMLMPRAVPPQGRTR